MFCLYFATVALVDDIFRLVTMEEGDMVMRFQDNIGDTHSNTAKKMYPENLVPATVSTYNTEKKTFHLAAFFVITLCKVQET